MISDSTNVPKTNWLENPSIYMERSGSGSRLLSEKLVAKPEFPLNGEAATEAYAFEDSICDYALESGLTIEELISNRHSEAPRFFAKAFLEGHVQNNDLDGQLHQLNTEDDVYTWLAKAAHDGALTPAVFRDLSRQSIAYYKVEMYQAVLKNTPPDESLLSAMSIVIEPDKALFFAQADTQAREVLLKQRALFPSLSLGIDGAKRAFVDIYTKRINGAVTSDIGVLKQLIQQSKLIGDTETATRAYEMLPQGLRDAITNPQISGRLNKRLDFIRQGIGYDSEGKASAVDAAVLSVEPMQDEKSEQKPLFSAEQKELLRTTMLSKEQIRALFEDILKAAELLSSEDKSSWSPGRGKRAEDELFQVVYQPVKETLAVNGVDGVILTPNGERSVFDILTIGAHELTHINQAQADLVLSKIVRIGKMKGRRVSMLRETGANLVQREHERNLFGESKPIGYSYAKALQAFESGGDIFKATKAFYDEKRAANPSISAAAAAKEAADRVLRLGMSGSNSQPMAYAEENIMNEELQDVLPEVRERATKLTTIDLDDQLRLHQFGLLPDIKDSSIDWTDLLMRYMQPYIEKALQE